MNVINYKIIDDEVVFIVLEQEDEDYTVYHIYENGVWRHYTEE